MLMTKEDCFTSLAHTWCISLPLPPMALKAISLRATRGLKRASEQKSCFSYSLLKHDTKPHSSITGGGTELSKLVVGLFWNAAKRERCKIQFMRPEQQGPLSTFVNMHNSCGVPSVSVLQCVQGQTAKASSVPALTGTSVIYLLTCGQGWICINIFVNIIICRLCDSFVYLCICMSDWHKNSVPNLKL